MARVVASGLCSGYAPAAPGTAGTLACVLLWFALHRVGMLGTHFAHAVLLALVCVSGVIAARVCLVADGGLDAAEKSHRDPGYVVIDEWAGVLVALWGVGPESLRTVATAFVLFRLFDIMKPGPVRWAERLRGEWGVMADDVVAGLLAALSLAVLEAAGLT